MFVSWAPFSRRTQTLSRRLGLDAVHVQAPGFKRPLYAPLKYPIQLLRTAVLLARRRPRQVWVMDPPAPAVMLAWLHCRRHGTPLVVDMHTVGFYDRKWRLLRPLEAPALRAAAACVVTNDELARTVRGWGGRAVVLRDPLPDPPDVSAVALEPRSVCVIATFSDDEPIDELPALASLLPDVTIYVTGRPRVSTSSWPHNLTATGLLDDAAFWRRLAASSVVAVFTRRPNTLLSGGYEALSLGKPLVVSDHAVLREYFEDAAVFVASTAADMAAGLREALERALELTERSATLARRREAQWASTADRVVDMVRAAP